MGASMVIPPQDEAEKGFGLLKSIVALAQNPKAIDEAYERQRKQAALTDSELKKYEEARAFMAQYDAAVAKLDERQLSIEAEAQELSQRADDFAKSYQEKSDDLTKRESEFAAKVEDHSRAVDAFTIARADMEKERQALISDRAAALAETSAKMEAADQIAKANADEQKRLDEASAEIERRLKKVQLREQAADL